MTNSDGRADALIAEILGAIADEYGWKDYVAAPLTRVTLDRGVLEKLAGKYRTGSDAALTVSLKEGALVGKSTEGNEFELVSIAAGEFVRRDALVRYLFETAAAGAAPVVTIVTPARKTAAPRMAEGERVPLEALLQGAPEEALAGYRDLWKKDPKDPAVEEGRINSLGYTLLGDKKAAAAVVLFEFNVERFPDSWNAHDSLGEGYAALGKTDLAIKSYERSLALNPGNANGRAMLEKLKR
jgi:tetratricopeptide (TPR) repeat protein